MILFGRFISVPSKIQLGTNFSGDSVKKSSEISPRTSSEFSTGIRNYFNDCVVNFPLISSENSPDVRSEIPTDLFRNCSADYIEISHKNVLRNFYRDSYKKPAVISPDILVLPSVIKAGILLEIPAEV